jgi:exodeoxyribonuclease V beta subunit
MERFLCLKASAGSGKTFALSVRYISLLLMDVNVTSILTLTFTNKAALEMSQRIYETLLSLGDDKIILEAISKETNLNIEVILAKKQEVLKGFINHELSIYTIDKFINKILREFCGYIDIDDNFNIDIDDEDLMLFKFLNSLDVIQFDMLINFSHDYSKKLSSIVELFKTLDEKNEMYELKKFDETLIYTLKTEILKDAQTIKEYVLNSALSISAKNAVGFDDIKSLLSKGKTWLTKNSLIEFSYFKKDSNISNLDDKFTNIKTNFNYLFKLENAKILNELFAIFNNFKIFRQNFKKEKNTFEFRDITNLAYELLSKHIQKDFLYFRLDVKYNHILIDEFQDTSVLQYKILKPLIDELLLSTSTNFTTFFYVGDTKQSIYRFRGGVKELFDWLIKDYAPLLKLQILDTNYRSSENIVGFVNNIFNNILNYEYHNQLINSKIKGYVEIRSFYLDDEEKYIDIKNTLEDVLRNGVNPKNIAILTYTNKDVLELYEYLSLKFPSLKIITELTSKLINQNNIKASINLIKYLYFKEDIYKSNFNALIGNNVQENINIKLYLRTSSLLQIVKTIGYKYNLFDENYLKFLDILSSYSDIMEFIYEIDKNDTPMINKETQGLQILTVFKSKGLEFDTVFVLDRINKRNSDKSSLLFEYDDINLKNIYYKNSLRSAFDKDYENALKNEQIFSIDDQLNVLYVSLTRAKNNMIIFKKEKQSVFDILKSDFTNQQLGELYLNNKLSNDIKINNINTYTPLNLGKQEVLKCNNIDSIQTIKAKYFGLATHYCLEMMKDFDIKSLDFNIKLTQSKYSNYLQKENFEDIYTRILQLISNEKFINIQKNSTYTKEQALIFDNEVKIIDLLIIKDYSCIIIDYKTTSQKQNSHNEQVKNYIKAIQSITKDKNIYGYIVYLHKNNIEFVKI